MHDFWFACVLFQTIWSTWMKIHQIEKTLKVNQLFWMFIVWIAVLSLFGYRRLPGSRMFCVCILFLFNDFCQPYYLNFNWTDFYAVFTIRFHYGCSWIDFRIFKGCHSKQLPFSAISFLRHNSKTTWDMHMVPGKENIGNFVFCLMAWSVMWDESECSVTCTLCKITFLEKWDEYKERPFLWPLTRRPSMDFKVDYKLEGKWLRTFITLMTSSWWALRRQNYSSSWIA